MLFSRVCSRIPSVCWMALLFIITAYSLWQLQQPQPVVNVAVDGKPLQCVSYAPYYKPGTSPTLAGSFIERQQIEADLKALSLVTNCVRTYSVSQGLDYVPQAAQQLGMKVKLGAWISWTDADNQRELALAVKQANQFSDTVTTIIVGNEVLLRGEQPESQLRKYLQWARAHTQTPLTYAEVWEFWLKHPALEQDVDVVTVHILPYWEDLPVAIEQAVSHTTAVMDKLQFAFKKPLFIGETGWPSQGRQRFGAKPSVVNQARYVREFVQAAQARQWQYNIIEAVDQPWKRGLEGTVGGYWGIYDSDLQAKFPLQGGVAERHDGWWPVFAAGLLALLAGAWARKCRLGKSKQALWVLAGASLGMQGWLQVNDVLLAARDTREWLSLGGFVLLGWWLAYSHLRQLSGLAVSSTGLQSGLVLFALAILLTSASLCMDGRYRNFPIALTWLPLAINAMVVLVHLGQSSPVPMPQIPPASPILIGWVALLGIFATMLAVAVAMLEPGNRTAWAWVLCCAVASFILPAQYGLADQQSSA